MLNTQFSPLAQSLENSVEIYEEDPNMNNKRKKKNKEKKVKQEPIV